MRFVSENPLIPSALDRPFARLPVNNRGESADVFGRITSCIFDENVVGVNTRCRLLYSFGNVLIYGNFVFNAIPISPLTQCSLLVVTRLLCGKRIRFKSCTHVMCALGTEMFSV